MAIITTARPDPKYYTSIVQLPDKTWSSEQKYLDDIPFILPGFTSADPQNIIQVPGLRTQVAANVIEYAAAQINKYAPSDVQRNALHTLTQTPTDANALATMNWVNAMNSYRDSQVANVKTLNFTQLVAYVVPTGIPPWPAPPSFLTPQ